MSDPCLIGQMSREEFDQRMLREANEMVRNRPAPQESVDSGTNPGQPKPQGA